MALCRISKHRLWGSNAKTCRFGITAASSANDPVFAPISRKTGLSRPRASTHRAAREIRLLE
jgi:hypothetical protein